jgi:hypothetical protein
VLSFQQYIRETPYETDTPVSIHAFLAQTPHPELAARAVRIAAAVKAGDISVLPEREIRLNALIPTQATVSHTKVLRYVDSALVDERSPLVVSIGHDNYLLLDGHHRVCSAALRGLHAVQCRPITPADFTTIH